MPNPLLSVVIPPHNAAPFIGEALAGNYGQGHPAPDAQADNMLALKRSLDRRLRRT